MVEVTSLSRVSTFVCQLFGVFGLHISQYTTPIPLVRPSKHLRLYPPELNTKSYRNGLMRWLLRGELDESKQKNRPKNSKKARYLLFMAER